MSKTSRLVLSVVLLVVAVCHVDISQAVIGGKPMKHMKNAPWTAAIIKSEKEHPVRSRLTCGATLVHPQWVLTLRSCLPENKRPIAVVIGAKKLRGKRRNVRAIRGIVYAERGDKNSVAMLKLNSPVESRSGAVPLRIPSESTVYSGVCALTAYGCISMANHNLVFDRQERAHSVTLNLISRNKCKQSYRNLGDKNICAGSLKNGNSGICFGDGGSGLICAAKNRLYLAGVMSYDKFNAPYAVYKNVAKYADFIKKTIAGSKA